VFVPLQFDQSGLEYLFSKQDKIDWKPQERVAKINEIRWVALGRFVMAFSGLVGKFVQVHCIDRDDPDLDWWEWGVVDHATGDYIVLNDEGEYSLIMTDDVKEVFVIEGRKKVYPRRGRSPKKA